MGTTLARYALVSIVLYFAAIILVLQEMFGELGGPPEYVPKSQRRANRMTSCAAKFHRILKHTTDHIFAHCAATFHNFKTRHKITRRRALARRHFMPNRRETSRWSRRNPQRHLHAKAALLAQSARRESDRNTKTPTRFDADSRPIGVDNRATAFMSGDKEDFVGPLHDTNKVVKGFGGSRTTGAKRGTARIKVEDDAGRIHEFNMPNSYFIPGIDDRLFSPQHWAQCLKRQGISNARETTDATHSKLEWGRFSKTIPLDPRTNVATFDSAPGSTKFDMFCLDAAINTEEEDRNPLSSPAPNYVTDQEEDGENSDSEDDYSTPTGSDATQIGIMQEQHLPNTVAAPVPNPTTTESETTFATDRHEAELLQLHYRYGHAPFSKLRIMARQGTIPRYLQRCRIPVCAACLFGKATKRAWRSKTTANRNAILRHLANAPGKVVSVDQLDSPSAGFIAQMVGTLTKDKYRHATVFVDHFSGFGYVFLQKSTSAAETLNAKIAFERVCATAGHQVHHYHADNGIFKANAWVESCKAQRQGLTFAGVDAHHQNGRAEARIRRLQETARAMMNHATRRWPQEMSTQLWPYAIRMASLAINATPSLSDRKHRSPDALFYTTAITSSPTHWRHPFCPVYVLDKALATGRHLSKWKNRSRIGLYLGPSPYHARNVSLVLDITSGLVSPQFHVHFDPNFDTVKELYAVDTEHFSKWKMAAGIIVKSPDNHSDDHHRNTTAGPQLPDLPTPDSPNATNPASESQPNTVLGGGNMPSSSTETSAETSAATSREEPPNQPTTDAPPTQRTGATSPEVTVSEPRRSGRIRKPIERLIEGMRSELHQEDGTSELFCLNALCPEQETQDVFSDLLAHKAKADPDTLYHYEARRQPDWNEFEDAMQMEIDQQVNLGIYDITPRSSVPEGATILKAVWQLRRKRDPKTGEIKKYKARCNIDGSRMRHGEHYEETYAPVAGWAAIRLLLAIILQHKWHSVQLDYVLAFPQAPAVRDLYMEIPAGFTLDGVEDPAEYVLKIKRNLYGGKDAGRTWFQYLKSKLEKVGFTQSEHDECIFYKGRMMYVLYTDDSILAGPNRQEIDETIQQMRTEGLTLTEEGDIEDFLGVHFERQTDGSIKLSQKKLIEQVLSDLRLRGDTVKNKETPAASSRLLSRHEESEAFDNSFNYRSVIGKLHYLVAGSRSEIAYAVHQCARFAHEPKREHGAAVRWIGRYLKGTADKGTILRPNGTRTLEVYVDSDFAGNWDIKLAGRDRSTARSRHGFYICYGGVPIAYKSSLQQEIAMSSTEAEITGLSYALREAIPIMRVLEEMTKRGYPVGDEGTRVHCKVFEDNTGAIEIARVHKARPRTKFLNNRLFHFRTYVDRGLITIHKIDTKEQPADILTKPLNEADFKKHRKAMNGW